MTNALVIEDEANMRLSIARCLAKAGHDVADADTLLAARKALSGRDFDVVIVDVNLGEDNGVELVREMRDEGRDAVVIVITAYGSVESAVSAMKAGADEYLLKPLSLEELTVVLERALERRADARRLRLYEGLERVQPKPIEAVGASPGWRQAIELADRLARAPLPAGDAPSPPPAILLVGETGVGKNVLARRIHETGARQAGGDAPFVHVNCSALPATLIESELFGHERGAFTDAREARAGLFEIAGGGTILLDEIAEMPIELQSKLLQVVETGSYRRVGGSRERRVRARIVAATNRDLERAIGAGAFRRDLFYRLNAFTIRIPPLRERREDIIPIAKALLSRLGEEAGRPGLSLSAEARRALEAHDWPGNVRELANAIQRAAMLAESDAIAPEDLGSLASPRPIERSAARASSGGAGNGVVDRLRFDFSEGVMPIDEVERALLAQALEHTRGNISRAAKLLGMSRSSFRYRVERAGLESAFREAAEK